MKKKLFLIISIFILSISIIACGGVNNTDTEYGKKSIYTKKENLEENIPTGPFNVTIKSLEISNLNTNDKYRETFVSSDSLDEDNNHITLIGIDFKVTNTSNDTYAIHPEFGTIVINDNIIIENFFEISDNFTDFAGKTSQEGKVYFKTKDLKAEDIDKLNIIVDGAAKKISDTEYKSTGAVINFDISME